MDGHVPLSVVLGVVALGAPTAVWLAGRSRRRQRSRHDADVGLGTALALALEGDLVGAQRAIRRGVERHGLQPEHVVAWVAVTQAAGQTDRAVKLVERLAARAGATVPRWLVALRVRLALAEGAVGRAVLQVERHSDLPTELVVATYVRAGRWRDARDAWRRAHGRRGSPRVAALLDAGVAAEQWGPDPPRAARRALKRALSHQPPPLAALAVAAVVAESEGERRRWSEALEARLACSAGAGGGRAAGPGVMREAQDVMARGEPERALGVLRAHMDDAPDDLTVRAQYALWLTDHGEPADWRAELRAWAERSTPASTAAFRCEACGFTGAHAWVICARCDGLETLQVVPAPAEGLPVVGVGARLADLQVLALRGR